MTTSRGKVEVCGNNYSYDNFTIWGFVPRTALMWVLLNMVLLWF